jgi:hypothetical protein
MMPIFMAVILAAGAPPGAADFATPREVICKVGAAALADLPDIVQAAPMERFYNGRTDEYHVDLLEICPRRRDHLPQGLKLATATEFERVRQFPSANPIGIFDVEVPVLSADGRHATVQMGYYCNGLCGTQFSVTYILREGRWKRDGQPRLLSVS